MRKVLSVITLTLVVSSFAATIVFASAATQTNCMDMAVTKQATLSKESSNDTEKTSEFPGGYSGIGPRLYRH